jgi:hypothetical protein
MLYICLELLLKKNYNNIYELLIVIEVWYMYITGHCKDCKNFNSMFAIVSGLHHTSVTRLHNTWEKVPSKYKKMYEVSYAAYILC